MVSVYKKKKKRKTQIKITWQLISFTLEFEVELNYKMLTWMHKCGVIGLKSHLVDPSMCSNNG